MEARRDGPAVALGDLVRGETVVAHGEFERIWLTRYGVDPASYIYNDTMARALACGLPPSLAALAEVLWPESPERWKDAAGHTLSLKMCRPRACKPGTEPRWWDREDPDKVRRLGEYCYRDVELVRWLDESLPELHEIGPLEPEVYELNWQMNRRGILLDRSSLERAKALLDRVEVALSAEFVDATGGAVTSPRAAVAFAEWLRSGGVEAPDVKESTVSRILERVDLRPEVRRALEIRQGLARSSTAKIGKMIQVMSPRDSRARGNSRYYGAHTGRPTGQGIQVRNLPRGKPDPAFWSQLHAGEPGLEGNAHALIAENLRGMLIPSPGKIFAGVDLSAIEALDLAYYAGDAWVLDEFRATGMLYEPMAVRWAGSGDIHSVTKTQRNAAKIGVLACGYGGGSRAYCSMGQQYGLDFSAGEGETAKTLFRACRPATVRSWYQTEQDVTYALRNPGSDWVGAYPRTAWRMSGGVLRGRLASGRVLCYPGAQLDLDGISYMRTDPYTRRWVRSRVWGGLLTENIIQARCRDIFECGALRLRDAGISVVLTVYDEILAECDPGEESRVVDTFLFRTGPKPAWFQGLPIEGKAWSGPRYAKT